MKHIPIRLGPLALLLVVISICMTTLGILTFTTARADLNMAEKYADTVRIRYELEEQGQAFLRDLAMEKDRDPGSFPGVETDDEGICWKTITEGEFSLVIGIVPEGDGAYRTVSWRLVKDWDADDDMGNLWDGNQG